MRDVSLFCFLELQAMRAGMSKRDQRKVVGDGPSHGALMSPMPFSDSCFFADTRAVASQSRRGWLGGPTSARAFKPPTSAAHHRITLTCSRIQVVTLLTFEQTDETRPDKGQSAASSGESALGEVCQQDVPFNFQRHHGLPLWCRSNAMGFLLFPL